QIAHWPSASATALRPAQPPHLCEEGNIAPVTYMIIPPLDAGTRSRLLLTWSSSITWSADPLRCLHRPSEASRSSGRGYSLHPSGALPHHRVPAVATAKEIAPVDL